MNSKLADQQSNMIDDSAHNQTPFGFRLRHTLQGFDNQLTRIAWSPDGRLLACGGSSNSIRVWDVNTGALLHVLEGHSHFVNAVAWSPDGRVLASASGDETVRLWDSETGQLIKVLNEHSNYVIAISWSSDGRGFASRSGDGTILIWSPQGDLLVDLKGCIGWYSNIAWSPDGQMIASTCDSGAVLVWDRQSWQVRRLEGASGISMGLAWSADGLTFASTGDDGRIWLWDAKKAKLTTILEGHTGAVISVSFASDGQLFASKSRDGTVRVWRCDTWATIAMLEEPSPAFGWPSSLSFHPTENVLATVNEQEAVISIWDLDVDDIVSAPTSTPSVSYTNAKVVLVGETGVGKTGLGVRLTEGVWRPTSGSTHGMNVWVLYGEPEREVMLWDFAGQDEYRLIHQLFLNETNIALLLYDPTKSQDTFFGVDYWEKALKNAVQVDMQKFLVAARVDVGGVRMTPSDIETYCRTHGYVAHFATSAETNEGCAELRAAILASIPWELLPRTSSPEVFKHIKDYFTAIRQGNRVLVRDPDIRVEFNANADIENEPTEDEFRTVIRHIETAGLIKRLSFGDFILLKPELLNSYASDIVDAARRHPDQLGAIRKADVLDGRIKLKDEGGLKESDKIFLLHATVELFLRLGLALEQDGNLVFPSKFNRRMPPLEEDPVVEVEFMFDGPVDNLYTTLVVKLYYGGIFRLKKLWKNAAEFLNARDCVCGLQLQGEADGSGTLKVFYAESVSDDDKALFLKIVADHFTEKRIAVERQRIYRCPECREVVRERNAALRAKERNKDKIFCQDCGSAILLVDALELLYHDAPKFRAQIAAMESRAEARMERGGELVSASAELRTDNFKTWAGGADIATIAVVFTDMVGGTLLNVEFGDEKWEQVNQAHFKQAQRLIGQGRGYLLKTKGDGVIAAFQDAGTALDFALALARDTGAEHVKIRAGIHIGPVGISTGDVFGQQVNMVARIEAKAEKGGIWVSAKVKEDINIRRAERHQQLKWIRHTDEELRGFEGRFTLWSVEE